MLKLFFLQEEGGDESESDFDYEAEISDMKRKKKSKSEKRWKTNFSVFWLT